MAGDKKQVLDLAAFLDSPSARELARIDQADVKRIAEAFLSVCVGEYGRLPDQLDEQELAEAVAASLPARFRPEDPLVEHAPAVLEAYLAYAAQERVVTNAFEKASALAGALPKLLNAVRSGRNESRQVRAESRPFVHGADKLGRNDPCSCGSGKKYKKCHGRNA